MNVLHIDCSIRNDWSVSKELSRLFISELKLKIPESSIAYLDVSKDTPKHPTALLIKANYTPSTERTPEMVKELEESEALVDLLHAADTYVIGMPMYNFSVPSNFKAFIDNIVRINRTFQLTSSGGSEGLLLNKKVFIINTRGVDFNHDFMQPMDQLQPYLRVVFGFMGVTNVTFINVSPVQFANQEARENAINTAKKEIVAAVHLLSKDKVTIK